MRVPVNDDVTSIFLRGISHEFRARTVQVTVHDQCFVLRIKSQRDLVRDARRGRKPRIAVPSDHTDIDRAGSASPDDLLDIIHFHLQITAHNDGIDVTLAGEGAFQAGFRAVNIRTDEVFCHIASEKNMSSKSRKLLLPCGQMMTVPERRSLRRC